MAHDPVARGQAETAAASFILGREEGLKQVIFDLVRHAHAGVDDADDDIIGRRKRIQSGRCLVVLRHCHRCRFQSQLSAAAHGIAGIDRQVQNDLSELVRIHLDVRASFIAVKLTNDRNVIAEKTQERALQILHKTIRFNHARLERLLATEGQKLPGQSRGASGGAADLGHMAGDGSLGARFGKNEVAVAQDSGQKIIEIMRDAGRQLSERFHFLGATQLVLQLFTRGNIHERTDESGGLSGRVALDDGAFEDLKILSASLLKSIFAAPMLQAIGERCPNAGGHPRAIRRMDVILPKPQVERLAGFGVTEQRLQALWPEERPFDYIPIPNCIVRSPGNDLKIVVALRRTTFR